MLFYLEQSEHVRIEGRVLITQYLSSNQRVVDGRDSDDSDSEYGSSSVAAVPLILTVNGHEGGPDITRT